MISSESNAQIKEVVKLQKQAKYRRKAKLFVVEGLKLIEEAGKHKLIERVFVSESLCEEVLKNHVDRHGNNCKTTDIISHLLHFEPDKYPSEIVSDALFKQISETVTPQGILATVKMPEYELEYILSDKNRAWLLLDGLRDPGNLGTIMRTAEGAGMSGIIMSRECVDLFNPKVVRSTMGAIFRMPFVYADSLSETVEQIKNMGCGVYGAAMAESVVYDEPDYTKGTAIVIGNEAKGISDKVMSVLTAGIRIPMGGELESLNAAVAAAVIMYEMARQRRSA